MREGNADNAGPSRKWRPEGAPTTDEALLVLLQVNGLSIVLLSSVSTEKEKEEQRSDWR